MKDTVRVAWHHFAFRVPSEWEVTAYSIEPREGRLEFSTRRGFAAMVAWEPCRSTPHPETIMTAFLSRLPEQSRGMEKPSPETLTTRRAGPFLMGTWRADQPAQAVCYLEASQILLRWVFAATGQPSDVADWAAVLESFAPNNHDPRDYALFGINVSLPEDFRIEEMEVLPANIRIVFENRSKRRVTFRRWGLPELVTAGQPLATFYTRLLTSQGCRIQQAEQAELAGMEAARLRFEQRPRHEMDTLMGRWWIAGEAWTWWDRETMRLYGFEQIGPDRAPPLDLHRVWSPAIGSRTP